jgi:hypothetical protein
LLTRAEQKLLFQLQQIESVFRSARLKIDIGQKLADEGHHLGNLLLVCAPFRRLLQHGLKEQRVTSETSSWLGKIRVEFELV